jgi:hypothetical protein
VVRRHDDGVVATMTATPLVIPTARPVGVVVLGWRGKCRFSALVTYPACADRVCGCGATSLTFAGCSALASRRRRSNADGSPRLRISPPRASSASSSRPTTGRRSPYTTRLWTDPMRAPRWITTSRVPHRDRRSIRRRAHRSMGAGAPVVHRPQGVSRGESPTRIGSAPGVRSPSAGRARPGSVRSTG